MIELKGNADMGIIFGKIYDELKTVPITLMFMAGIYVAVGILWGDHVSKADFLELKTEMQSVQYTLQRDHADSRLHAVEQELFNLSQHANEERQKGHVVDPLYDQRINDLQNQHQELLRELNRLESLSHRNI